ncbi:hypothetical protein ABPG74_013423 [Tetrahymena malaccensis]
MFRVIILLLTVFAGLVKSQFIQEFSDPSTQSIISLNSAKGQQTFYQVDFSFQNNQNEFKIVSQLGASQLNINLKFPKEITLPNMLNECQIFTLLQGVSSYQNIDCQINQFSNSVQFNIDGSLFVQSANSIIFGQVNNPTNYDQSSDFELCINNNSNRIICQFRFGKQSFADPPIQMISAQVTPMSWLKISSGASYSFKFQLVGIYLSGHSIRIMFPQHFTSNSAYVRIQDNTCEKTISNLHMGRVIECLVLSQPISGLVQVDIINMINPNYSGYFMGFQIDLLKYSSNLIIETIQFDGQIQIQPGKIFASLDTTVDKSLISFGIPVYYLTIQTEHMLQNGYIQIQFDSQWQITSNTCTIVQIQEDDPPNYSCQLQGSNFIVSTFIQLQSYQKIIIELPIIQPSIQGQRGPIEILLFLNVQLPPTTSLTVGKIVITITPQVQQPVTQQNGILKCLFYERVMATSCVLNNSQSGKTIITVYTPSNYSFFQSEIPLIITTEGAIPEGILVNTILQRYEFTVKTFNSDNPVASPLEIFYGEWVPDSFQLTNAIINPLALEQLEILVVQISFSCPVDLIMSGSSTNYAFILYFVSGVNIVIPPGQNSIQNFSCFLQGLTGVNVRCDLYQDRIQIYGFQSLVAGSSVTIIVSEIPLTVAPNTILNLTFSINQITPGMPTQYVQLYQINQQWVLFLQSQPNIYNMDYEVSVLQSSAVINSNPSFTISYTLNPIDTVLYYFPSSFKYILNSSTFTCGSSTCYYLPRAPSSNGFIILEKKAQPIANNPPNYNQLTVIPLGVIQAPPFQGNFPVNLYALFSQRVIKKAFFYIKFGSDLITTASFIITNPGQFIIKNTEHYFTVSFITKNYIPDQGSIQIFFHNGVTVQPNRYQLYCQLQSPQFLSLSYFPIQCSKNDSTNSLTITGFKIINSGVQLTITLRLLTDPVQSPINPTCDIYTLDQNGNPIDSITGVQNANNPITNNISSLQQFNIIDNYYRQNEYPPINYVGPFILQFQQSATIVAALNTIEVQFDSGFQIPNGISQNAPMYCQVNQVRAYCKVTSYTPQLTVQVYPQTNPAIVVNPITSNTLLISTEYVSPLDGIQHPSYADFYQVQVKLIDQFGNINLSTKYTKINPLKLVFFYVNSYCSSPGQYNLLLFHARFSQNVVKFSGGGRIYLVFPTFNQAGIALFSSNLGLSYDPLVDNLVACNFSQSQNTINAESGKQLKCRLKPQDYNSDSIRVEIINFDNISVDQEMYVFMTQIMNPSNLLVDITFQIEVQIIDQANSSILSNLNLDYFNVFLNMKSSTPNPDLTNPYTGNIFSSPSSVGSTNVAMISNKVYYTTAFSAQDIYYVQLPPNITPTLNFAGCDATQFLLCLSFPDANVLVYVTNSIPALTFSNINDSIISQLPISVPQTNTVFYSYVWQKTLYQGRVINQITANQWKSLIGSLSNVILNLMNSQTPLIKSIKTFIQLKFTTTHFIPAGGSIVIQFPIDFPAIYSHCESSFQNGSKLQSNYLTNSGSFGCSVQNNLQWVISNINQVQANSNIIITGRVDLPTTQITTQSLQITTLSTGFSANTLTSGFLIDQILNAPNTVLTMSQYSTMCMGFNFSYQKYFYFNFQIKYLVQPEIDYVDIQQDILRSNFRGPLRMHLIINDNVLGNQGKFQIDLFRYELVLTTVNGINQEGIQFGLNPGTFRISLACDPQGLGAFKTIDQVYVQIYSNDFQQILVQSLINIPGEWNLILLKIQPQVTIKVTDQIILEFPVISLDSKNLFTENGGYSSLNDSDIILYDLVDASANLSANPTIPANSQLSIPIQIYTYDIIQESKTHYRHEINAIPILNPGMNDVTGINGDFDLGNSQNTVCHNLVQTIHFRAQQSQQLQFTNQDVYLLRLNFPLYLNQPTSLVNCQYNNVAPTPFNSNCAILVNNGYILVFPSQSGSLNPTNLIWINNAFFTPYSKLESAAQRVVIGFAYYSSRRLTERIMYFDSFPQLLTQVSSSVSMSITSKGNIIPYQNINMDYIFTITAPYWSIVKKLAVVFPISSGFSFTYSNCKEAASSQVQIQRCDIDSTNKVIWITIQNSPNLPYFISKFLQLFSVEFQNIYLTQQIKGDGTLNLSFQTLSLTMVNPQIAAATQIIPYNNFDLKFYSWYTAPAVTLNPRASDDYVCFSDNKQMAGGLTINADKAGVYPVVPNQFDYIHQQYFDEFVAFSRTQRIPIKVEVESPVNIPSTTWSASHKIIVHYNAGIQIPTPSTKNDLLVDALVCYINNMRVRCTNDSTNLQIIVEFIEAQALGSNIYIYVSAVDPNNLEKDGFFYIGNDGAYTIKYEIIINGGNSYFLYSDFFSAFYSTQNQPITPPHRGIEVGSITSSNNFKGAINVLEFTLSFDRSDIKGLVFEFLTVDQLKNQIYTTTTMHGLQTGSPFPCSKGIPVPNSSPDCNLNLSNPTTTGCQFPIKCFIEEGQITQFGKPIRVHAFGFAYTPKQPETFRLMVQNPTGTPAGLATPIDFLIVVKAYGGNQNYQYPYGNEFKGDYSFLGVISLVQNTPNTLPPAALIPSSAMWQINTLKFTTNQNIQSTSQSSLIQIVLADQTDQNICFFAPDQYVRDIFYLQVFPTPTTMIKYVYAYRLFQASESSTKIFNLGSLKCEHYRYNVVGTSQTNTIFQNGATSCTVMSGLSILNTPDHIGEQVQCAIETNTISGGIATRLKISNFDSIINYPYVNSLGSPLPQKDMGLKIRIMHTNSQYSPTNPINVIFAYYANSAAYLPSTSQGHLMFYTILSHTPDYSFPMLTTPNNQGFINQSLNIGTYYKITKITNNALGAQNNIQMTIDFQTNQDMYIGGDCTNVSYCMTCTCAQSCNAPLSANRQYWGYWYLFLFGLELDQTQTTCTIDVLGRIKKPNSPFDPEEVIACKIIYSTNGYPMIYIEFFEQFQEMGSILNYKNKPWEIYITLINQTFAPTNTQNYVWSRFHIYQQKCFNPTQSPSTVLLMENVFTYTTDYLQIGNTPSFSSLTLEQLYTTEYSFSLNNINLNIGVTYNTVLQLVFPTYVTNFIYATDPTKESQQISCLCSIPLGSPLTPQLCYRRIPINLFQATVLLYINVQQGNSITCYIPEIINPSAQNNLGVLIKVASPSIYSDYQGVGGYANVYQQTILVNILAQGTLKTGTFDIDPPTFYNSRQVNEQPLVRFAVDVNSQFFNWPYIYIRLPSIGPVPTLDFCNSPIFLQNRVYSVQSLLIVCQIGQNPNQITVFKGSPQLMMPAKPFTFINYELDIYVFDGTQGIMTHSFQQLFPSTNFNLAKTTLFQVTNIFLTLNVGLQTQICAATFLLNSFVIPKNKGRILISFSKTQVLLAKNACFVVSIPDLQCYYDGSNAVSHRLWIYRTVADLNTQNTIDVYFSVQNSATSNIDFTLIFYYSYTSDTTNQVSVQNLYTQTIQTADSSSTKLFLSYSYMKLYPFTPKIYTLPNTSERFFITFQNAIPLVQHMRVFTGKTVDVSQVSIKCTLRQYDSVKVMSYNTFLCSASIFDPTGSPAFEILFSKVQLQLLPNVKYEFIISTLNNNQIIGFQKDTVNTYREIWMFARQLNQNLLFYTRLLHYYDQGIQQIQLNSLYYTSGLQQQTTSLFLQFTLNPALPNGYPTSFISLTFPELTIAQAFPTANPGDTINCQLSTTFQQITSRMLSPRCIIVPSENGQLQIRIEQFNSVNANTQFSIAIDDMLLPAKYVLQWWNMNLLISVYLNDTTLYFLKVQQLLVVDGVTPSPTVNTIGPFNFNPPSNLVQGQISDYPVSVLNYPINSNYYDMNNFSGFKIRLQFFNGILAANKINNILIQQLQGATSQALNILWVNSNTNSIYISAPLINQSQQMNLVFKGLTNPYTYQQLAYGTNPYVQANFYQGNNMQRQTPLLSHQLAYTANLNLNPNIAFTSTYLNSFQSCHITAANTVDILNVGDFNIAQGFSIFIQGHVISNNVQYIFELQTSDYLDDSSSPQTYTINQFDSVAKIYNELDLLQQKYIFGYYETAFTQLFFQDITPSLVFYIQFDSLLSLTYNTNYFEVSTATLVQVNQANGIMCSFSPVLTTSDLGLTIFCSCLYNSATNSYQIQSPVGGLNTNQQYALKIQEVVQNSQIQLQTVSNNGQELIFLNIRNAATNTLIKQQTLSLFFITRFNTINIKHATTTATFYDVIQINFSVTKDVVQNANEEVQLALHIESNYYLQDLGITQVYQSDNLGPFTSGQQFNCVLTPNLQIGIKPNCILQFGQYSNKFDQIRIIVSNIGNVLSGTTYTLNIGMILNPSTIQNTIDYTFLIIKKRISSFTTEQISQYVYKKRLLNHDYAKDPSLAVALQSSDFVLYNNINNQIQTNQLGMAISIFNTNLATVNQILLKYDNTLNGILNLQQVLSNLIIANCQVVYFAIINLVMLTPLQSIAKPASFNLGSSYQSQNYQSQWGFSLVWITDYSTAQTLYYNNNLQRNTLSVITDLALKNLNRISGVQNVGSQNLYEINFLTPFIPKQGIININLPSQLNFYKSQLNCIKLVKNFNVNPIYSTIRAFYDDSTNVIQIYAFGDIPSNTKVTIRLLLDNMNSGQAVNLLSIQILGNLKIASSLIVKSSAVVGVAIFNAPTISSSLQLLQITQTHLVTYFTQEFNALNLQISTSLTTLVNGNNYIELVFDQTNAQLLRGQIDIYQQNLQFFVQIKGLKYPIRGVLRNVVLNIRNSGTNALVESSYIEYEPQVRKDNSFNLRVINCYSSQNSRGMKFQFNLNYKVSAGDEIRILFEMNDEINQIFVPYLGFNQAIQQIQCQETSSPQVISASSALLCNLQSNQIRIPFQQSVNPSTVISFWISNIINPSMQTTIGIYLQIMTYCRGNQGNLEQNDNRCILYHSKNYYTTQPLPPNGIQYGLQVSPMVPSTNTVFVMASHSFQIVFTNAVPANKDILITYPDNHIHTQPCNSAQGQCQILNNRSIIFNPTTPINAGQTYSFTLNNVQNGISLSSLSQDNYIYIEIYDGQTSLISQAYKIIFNPYTPYTQGISASIYNTQTQNTYLKGNFQNIAQLLVSNIWHDQYITSFVIWKPAVIQGFIDQSYCNATLLIPNPNPFPLILQCSISALGDAIYISSNGVTYQSTFSSLVLSVYFKVIIDSNFPPQGVPAGFTDNLIVYGCVQQCNTINPSRFYQTMATTQLYVSNDRVPYYAGISWNQYAFHQAKSIFQGEARFYGVIQQSSPNQNINKIILQIEDSFLYPPIMFIQGCLIYNNQVTIQIDKCQLKQVQGKSQIEIVLSSGYFLSLQPNFFYIQTQAQQFQAPEYPGQHYQIKVDLYQANTNNPIEEVQVFFSRVIGVQFDRNSMQFLNGLDAKIPNLNELIFVTSNVPIPQGYLRQDSDVYSEIHVLFEWIPSGVQKGSGYAADIGTGLQDGQQLDCISKAGLQFTQGKGIKCFLKIAQTSDSTSRIRILNYEAINPNTKIDLIFIGIQSLDINVSGLIKVAVELVFNYLDPVVSILNSGLRSNTYDQAINRSYLYMPSPLMPDLTSSLQVTTNTNPTTVTQTGSTTTLGYSSFSFTFTLGSQNLKTTDYVAFIFPSGFIPQHITDFSSVTSPQGSNVYVFSLGSTIFVQPFTQQNMNSVVTITINNLINPFFTIQLGVLQISAFTYINRKQDTSYVFNLQNYHNDYNTLISNTNLQYNSTVARAKNVQYTIQFQLNQFLPHFGIIQVIFPTITFKSLYNLDGFSCYLDGYQDQSICQVGGSNKANIYIQNLLLTPNSVYTIVLNNISNPSIDISQVSQAQYFSLAIYYNSQYLNVNQPYSMVSIGYPLITQIYVRPIYFVVQVDYPIYQIESLYKFQILCNFDISENSRIVIILGQSYSYYPQQSGTSTKIECSSPYILSETCQVQYSLFEGSYTLEIQTVFVPLLQTFQISAILMNPSYDPSPVFYQVKIYEQGQIYSYYASSTINSNQRLQQTIQFYPIQSSSSSVDAQIFSSSFILSQNIPNQPNQQAYYVFKLCQNNNNLKKIFGLSQNQVIMTLKFPDNFANMNSYQSSIEYFIDYYQPDQKIYSVLMIEQLISTMKLTRVSQINNLQSQFYSKNTIQFILNISQQIDPNILNSWNYLIVKNIVNPQKYIPQNFELKVFDSFSNFQIMYLNVAKQLQYQIVNETPSLIMISSIQPQSFLFNQITDYIFTIEYSDNLLQIIHTNQYYLLIVTLPLQQKIKYLQNIQCFIQGHQNQIKANSDQCYIFTSIDSTNISIALKLTFQLISSSSFQLVIRNLINPTYNFPSIQVNEFSVKIMDYSSSQIICSDINYRILNPKYYSHTIYFQNPYSLTIQVGGPAVLYRGLKYEYKIMLQAPAYNLVIIPVVLNYLTLTPIKSSQIQITPSQITFENFQNQLTQSFFLSFAFDYPIASQSQYFILRFQQTQDSQLDNFINVPDLNIQLSNDQAIKPVIALNLDNLDINTQGYPFFISVSISSLPAQPTYLSLVSDQNDKFYSADFINNLVISNSKILITDSTEYQFQVCYQGKNIPQPIPLKIQILSQNQNIQNLYKFYPSNKFYLVFSYSPYYSNSIARIQIMSFTPDYNYTQLVGKPIAYQNVSNYSPHIMKVVQDSVSQTTANFIIFIDQLCKISYIVTLGQEQVEPNTQNFLSNYYQFAVNIGSVFTNQFNLQLIENMQQILLVNLQAQQNYIIYFMAQNAMGYSSIYKQYFNTSDISQPCSLYLTFQDIVNNQTLIMGLSSILRISPNNIMILSSFNVRNNNSPSYGYLHTKQALVIPDILGSYDPKTLLYSSQNQILKQLDRFIPSFDKASILSIQEMPIQIPEFTSLPILISLNIYDATFSINTQVQSIVFAVFVPEIQINIQPYQIANCINANNQLVEKVNCIKVISETSGYSSVFIDFLNEQTTYYGYFTAAALTPYNSPLHLSKQVKMVSFTTNANSKNYFKSQIFIDETLSNFYLFNQFIFERQVFFLCFQDAITRIKQDSIAQSKFCRYDSKLFSDDTPSAAQVDQDQDFGQQSNKLSRLEQLIFKEHYQKTIDKGQIDFSSKEDRDVIKVYLVLCDIGDTYYMIIKGMRNLIISTLIRGKCCFLNNLGQVYCLLPTSKLQQKVEEVLIKKLKKRKKRVISKQNQSPQMVDKMLDLTDEEFLQQKFPSFKLVKTFKEWEGFGDIALITQQYRTATMVCKEDCYCITLTRSGFEKVIGELQRKQKLIQVKFLKQFPFFSGIPKSKLMSILMDFEVMKYSKNKILFEEGQPIQHVFFILEGEVEIYKKFNYQNNQRNFLMNEELKQQALIQAPSVMNSKNNTQSIRQVGLRILGPNSYCGIDEIFNGKNERENSAKCISPSSTIYILSKDKFLDSLKVNKQLEKNNQDCIERDDLHNQLAQDATEVIQESLQKIQSNLSVTSKQTLENTSEKRIQPLTKPRDIIKERLVLVKEISSEKNQKNICQSILNSSRNISDLSFSSNKMLSSKMNQQTNRQTSTFIEENMLQSSPVQNISLLKQSLQKTTSILYQPSQHDQSEQEKTSETEEFSIFSNKQICPLSPIHLKSQIQKQISSNSQKLILDQEPLQSPHPTHHKKSLSSRLGYFCNTQYQFSTQQNQPLQQKSQFSNSFQINSKEFLNETNQNQKQFVSQKQSELMKQKMECMEKINFQHMYRSISYIKNNSILKTIINQQEHKIKPSNHLGEYLNQLNQQRLNTSNNLQTNNKNNRISAENPLFTIPTATLKEKVLQKPQQTQKQNQMLFQNVPQQTLEMYSQQELVRLQHLNEMQQNKSSKNFFQQKNTHFKNNSISYNTNTSADYLQKQLFQQRSRNISPNNFFQELFSKKRQENIAQACQKLNKFEQEKLQVRQNIPINWQQNVVFKDEQFLENLNKQELNESPIKKYLENKSLDLQFRKTSDSSNFDMSKSNDNISKNLNLDSILEQSLPLNSPTQKSRFIQFKKLSKISNLQDNEINQNRKSILDFINQTNSQKIS